VCIPLVIGTGYIQLHVTRLKDVTNKRWHEDSAQLACEAAGAIRTVASLTREDDCYREYSRSLEIPLQISNSSSIWSTSAFAISQSMVFFVVALIFWQGSKFVASLEYDITTFFVCMMVRGYIFYST
jgi:ATP-binding cassette subfamily B (MDR/TAP) protein 1